MNNASSKQELIKAQEQSKADMQKKLDDCSIGQFMNTSAIKNRINSMLGTDRGLRFITGITSAVSTNMNLAECTNTSIFNGALLGETLNLSPSPQLGHYYLVPYKKKRRDGSVESVTAQFQLGYKGYIQLAIRSGQYKKINVVEVKDGEFVGYDMFNEEIHINQIKDYVARKNACTVGYYAMFEYLNGFKKCLYMSKEEMLEHANTYSSAFNKNDYQRLLDGKIAEKDMWKYSSFWYKNFDEMAKKTMLRQLISKWGIMSTEMQKAFENDMGVIKEDGSVDYVDNISQEEIPIIEQIDQPVQEAEVQETENQNEQMEVKTEQKEVRQVDMHALFNN